MMKRKKVEQMIQTVIATCGEWDSTAYVPVVNVKIIATTETTVSTDDTPLSFETSWGSSYVVEMK